MQRLKNPEFKAIHSTKWAEESGGNVVFYFEIVVHCPNYLISELEMGQ